MFWEGRGLKSDPGWVGRLLTGNFPLSLPPFLPPSLCSARFSHSVSLLGLKCTWLDAPHPDAHARTFQGHSALSAFPGSTLELIDFYSLQTSPCCDDGGSILPARLRVGVPGQLGSRLFGVQRSAGPESSQQTQVGALTWLLELQVIRNVFCVKMFRDVGPWTGTRIFQRVVSVETSELLMNKLIWLVLLTHYYSFLDIVLNRNGICLGCVNT